MGEYFIIVNLDKKEFFSPSTFGDGLKLREFAPGAGRTAMALALMLSGPWQGNRIAVVGDSYNRSDLYAEAKEHYTDVGPEVAERYREDFAEAEEYARLVREQKVKTLAERDTLKAELEALRNAVKSALTTPATLTEVV